MSSHRSLLLWSLLVFGAMSLQASLAVAQVGAPRPERPDRGLYGNAAQATSDLLSVNGSAGAGWDNNILLDLPGTDPRTATGESGSILNGGGGISYSRTRRKASFAASEASSIRFYPGQTIEHIVGHSASIGVGLSLNDRTRFSASEVVSYQPFTFVSLFPQSLDPTLQLLPVEGPALELAANKSQYLQYASSLSFDRTVSRRTTFYAGYNFSQGDTAYGSERFTNQGGNAGLRWSLTRNLGLRTGYGYQEGRYGSGEVRTLRYHNIDVGLDYNRALSFSRRTTVTFGTGTTALSDGQTTSYHATGNARLNHEIGRTWQATISYDRTLQFVNALLQTVSSDAASAGVGGLVNRRVRVETYARASLGSMGTGSQRANNDYDTYQGIATVAIALSRHLDLGVDYTIYRYRFGSGAVLPIGIPRDIERQSISVHVDVWAPLYSRARRNNNASR